MEGAKKMSTPTLEPIQRLSKDLKNAAKLLSRQEARYLVDSYYQLQDVRKVTSNQVRGILKPVPGQEKQPAEPCDVLMWFQHNSESLESQIKRALEAFALNHPEGRWAYSITGIGPVIAAGLLAHIDIEKAPTVGHIWRFAGIDPTLVWNKGERRPFNASLKILTWKIGQSFLKNSGHEDCIYGKLLLERWAFERANNFSGKLAEQATAKLARFNIKKATDAYAWYSGQYSKEIAKRFIDSGVDFSVDNSRQIPKMQELQNWSELPEKTREKYTKAMLLAGYTLGQFPVDDVGTPMLPPAHILQRACRYATKLFLSHFQEASWFAKYAKLPIKPYVLDHVEGHIHFKHAPNMKEIPGWSEARAALASSTPSSSDWPRE